MELITEMVDTRHMVWEIDELHDYSDYPEEFKEAFESVVDLWNEEYGKGIERDCFSWKSF